jgi:hypothetical protein
MSDTRSLFCSVANTTNLPDGLTDELLNEEIRSKKIANEEAESANNLRSYFAKKILYGVGWYLIACLLITLLQGFSFLHFNLDNSVLKRLLETGSINVTAMLIIVLWYLFPKRKVT